jgi:DNA-binding response OmpR family regulator
VVRLPTSTQRVAAATATAVSSSADALARPKILVVDDNVDAADMLGLVLNQAGYEVCIAFDGKGALEVAREKAPEMAILDIGLPEMSGYELAPLLRASIGQVPLIALSGYGQESDRERSRQAGFDAHLVKPVSPSELEATIQRLARN